MNRYAYIENGIVTNIVMWNGDTGTWLPPDGVTMVKLDDQVVDIGNAFDGTSFSDPGLSEAA